MGQLFFKLAMQQAIRAGTKRTTIRRWSKPRVRSGQRVYTPGLGWLQITAVDPIELSDLNDKDARADGFETAKALRAALDELYPDHPQDGKLWFRVLFEPDALVPERAAAGANQRRLFEEP